MSGPFNGKNNDTGNKILSFSDPGSPSGDKYLEDLRELRHQYSHLLSEAEQKQRDLLIREEKWRLQLMSYQNTIRDLQGKYAQLYAHAETMRHEFQLKEKNYLQQFKNVRDRALSMEERTKQALNDSNEARKQIAQAEAAVTHEKERFSQLEDLISKERREKQIALTCLHTTEARLAQASRELEELKRRINQRSEASSFELKF